MKRGGARLPMHCAFLLLLGSSVALRAPQPRYGRAGPIVCGEGYCRASDLFQTGPRVAPREAVKLLGRWRSSEEWDSIGVAKALDEVLAGERSEYDEGLSVEATPRRRDFCRRKGLVQRYIFNATVGLLPFRMKRLAESVGATLYELDIEPIEPLAIDIVFDALAESQSGIVSAKECDQRRASFETADGAFDHVAFEAALARGRRKILTSYAIWPGVPSTISLIAAVQLDAASALSASLGDVLSVVNTNLENGPAALLLPLLPLALVAYGAANPPSSNKAAGEAAARDRRFVATRVSLRQETELATEAETLSRTAEEVPTPTTSE